MVGRIALNLPWTIAGLLASVISVPRKVEFMASPPALVVRVRSLWWCALVPELKGARALTNGNLIQLGPRADGLDLKHELVHVEQFMREPFLHPFLYMKESARSGYRGNAYEKEAYDRVGNRYEEG